MDSITKRQEKIIETAVSIQHDPHEKDLTFLTRQLVQATLPHSNPGNIPLWTRTNGNLRLTIQSGSADGKIVGYPYGTIPRLLLYWMTTEAIRTKSRRLCLGDSLSQFMEELGLSPTGGRWGTIPRLREQMTRLLKARISFENKHEADRWSDMLVAEDGELWWNFKQPDNATLFESWIELGEKFYQAIISVPVPFDRRELLPIKNSSLALDLHAWLNFTAWTASQKEKNYSVSWSVLQEQFGADYSSTKEFSRKAKKALQDIGVVCPHLYFDYVRGGVVVKPSPYLLKSKESTLLPQLQNNISQEEDSPIVISETTKEKAQSLLRQYHPVLDIDYVMREFVTFSKKKGKPKDIDAAFLGFIKYKAERA